MSTATLRSFLEELLRSFDSDMDLSAGSPAQREVIDPILARFEISPFEMDLPTFIKARLTQEFPKINLEDGEPLADVLVKACEALMDPLVRELTHIKNNQSLGNAPQMAVDEVAALIANHFTEHDAGDYATGALRIYYPSPRGISITTGNVGSTGDGLNFLPTVPQAFTAEQMLLNQDGDLYYVDVTYRAEKAGDDYNVAAGKISSITNMDGAVKVTNLARFRNGLPSETSRELAVKGENSLSNRSLDNKRGALAKLQDAFPGMRHLQAVGLGDPEMQRDIIRGGGLGPVVLQGTDGTAVDDGDGDGTTRYFQSAVGGFTALGTPNAGDYVVEIAGTDRDIVKVISDNILEVRDQDAEISTLAEPDYGLVFTIREVSITLSGIPGGIVAPNGPNGTLVVRNQQLHIGGCMDLFVRGTDAASAKQVVAAISDELPLLAGTSAAVKVVGAPAEMIRDASLPASADFVAKKVRSGMTFRIKAGPNAQDYQILQVLSGTDLLVYPAPLNVDPVLRAYEIVDDITVDLNEPKTTRGKGVDLTCVSGSNVVSTTSGVDFSALGAQVGDTLRVSGNTLNVGDVLVSGVTGAGNTILLLAAPMKQTRAGEVWHLFKKGTGLDFPLLRLTDIDLLAAGTTKTSGVSVPHADPIDIRTASFSNVGVGTKKAVEDAVVGIIGSVDLSAGANVSGKWLLLMIDSTPHPVVFTGANPLSSSTILGQINAVVSGLTEIRTVSGEERLCFRSTSRHIVVDKSGTANALLGLHTAFDDDNRQISSDDAGDWTTLGLVAEKDSVYLLTGSNAGEFFFLHRVGKNRLLVSQVGETSGKAVFPMPANRATVRVGSRSIGKARCYFLQPTSFEAQGRYRGGAIASASSGGSAHRPNSIYGFFSQDETPRALFSHDVYGDEAVYRRYTPDPELKHQVIPAGTAESVPNNLKVSSGSDVVESEKDEASLVAPGKFSRAAEIDFLRREIEVGDEVEITYQPIQGTVAIDAAVINNLKGKTLFIRIENSETARSVTFTTALAAASGVAAQINQQAGATIAYLETDSGTGDIYLRLEADFSFMLLGSGTANTVAGLPVVDTDNDANAQGKYTVVSVGYVSGATSNHMRLQLDATFTVGQAGNSQHFIVRRPGLQRTSATQMQSQTEGGLYYADVELVSEGPGDEFNLAPDKVLEVTGHASDGWRFISGDTNLTFSEYEKLKIELSRRMLQPGQTDNPQVMTFLTSRSVEINYERSDLVEQIQTYAQADMDRTLVANILVRHLTPHYVFTTIGYSGGSKTSVISADTKRLIESLDPDEELEVASIVDKVKARGATSVTLPIVLVGVVWTPERTIKAVRSEDSISHNRLATFFVGSITVNRSAT